MWWLILEACSAFFIFAFIVWWTMFSGRKPDPNASTAKPAKLEDETDHSN